MPNVFAVPLFFILFRETLETSIIVAVLLSFLKRNLNSPTDLPTYKKLRRQVWYGTALGFSICLVIGSGVIGAFYHLGTNAWAGTEKIWEAVFALLASVIITLMGGALLRVSKLQDKWRVKLGKALAAKKKKKEGGENGDGGGDGNGDDGEGWRGKFKVWCEKYAMFILPFVTVLREGLEAVVFAGGVSLGYPARAMPLAVVAGVAAGVGVGVVVYKGGNRASLQLFLIVSTCFLYLVAAGLFSRAVWMFEIDQWNKAVGGDASETGSGPGSYDVRRSVWHLNCCSPDLNGGAGWGIFSHVLGWQNSATVGSVVAYNVYWVVVIGGFVGLGWWERKGVGKGKGEGVGGEGGGVAERGVEKEGVVSGVEVVGKGE